MCAYQDGIFPEKSDTPKTTPRDGEDRDKDRDRDRDRDKDKGEWRVKRGEGLQERVSPLSPYGRELATARPLTSHPYTYQTFRTDTQKPMPWNEGIYTRTRFTCHRPLTFPIHTQYRRAGEDNTVPIHLYFTKMRRQLLPYRSFVCSLKGKPGFRPRIHRTCLLANPHTGQNDAGIKHSQQARPFSSRKYGA